MKHKRIHELRAKGYNAVTLLTKEEFFELLDCAEGVQHTPTEIELEQTQKTLQASLLSEKHNRSVIKDYDTVFWQNFAKYEKLEQEYIALEKVYEALVNEMQELQTRPWWKFWNKRSE